MLNLNDGRREERMHFAGLLIATDVMWAKRTETGAIEIQIEEDGDESSILFTDRAFLKLMEAGKDCGASLARESAAGAASVIGDFSIDPGDDPLEAEVKALDVDPFPALLKVYDRAGRAGAVVLTENLMRSIYRKCGDYLSCK